MSATTAVLEDALAATEESALLGARAADTLANQREQLEGASGSIARTEKASAAAAGALASIRQRLVCERVRLGFCIGVLGALNLLVLWRLATNHGHLL